MRIAGVVILYYPKLDVINNILSYLSDLDILYVVDNSEQCNKRVVEQLKKYLNVRYIALGKNCGIAYALNLALQKSASYDYLLTMDQDSRFFAGEFRKYTRKVWESSRSDIAVYSVNYISNIKDYGKKCEDTFEERAITSGSIINVRIANEIGGFNTDLFIDGVDHDYCYKAIEKGYKILRFGNVFMEHHLGIITVHRFLWKKIVLSSHNAVRRYYITRNNIYIFFVGRYHQNLKILKHALVNEPIEILLYEKDKKRKFKAIVFGILDAFKGNMGKCRRKI